jgi:hypothetical protein
VPQGKQWHHDHTSIPRETLKASKAGLTEASKGQLFGKSDSGLHGGTLLGEKQVPFSLKRFCASLNLTVTPL